MGKRVGIIISLLALVWGMTAGAALAAAPRTINHQGSLSDAAGTPVNATVGMVFSLYDAASGGTPLWTETQSVPVARGLYSVSLGAVNPIGLPFDVPYYLGVKVGSDAEMTPRQALTSTGYAFRAGTVTSVSGAVFTNLADIPAGAGIIPAANLPFNSATTATSDNTAGAIVARNASGDFSAGTVTATAFSGSGAAITDLSAGNITSGTVAPARLGSGTANSSTYLRGDGAWAAPAPRIVHGCVPACVPSIRSGSGFQFVGVNLGGGDYGCRITFTPAFAGRPTIVATARSNSVAAGTMPKIGATYMDPSNSGVTILTYDDTGLASVYDFCFTAME